ncbi:MAG: DUF6916 family protein [Planctomycetota bacterium]
MQNPTAPAFTRGTHRPHEPMLPQQIYRIEHEILGQMDSFIVPLGPDAKGMRYEAVFN